MTAKLSIGNVVFTACIAAVLVFRFSEYAFAKTLALFLPIALTLYIGYWCWLYPYHISPLRHIPTVPGFPLWGHLPTIVTSEVGVPHREWHKKHGLIIRYFFPFGLERLSVADNDALHHITVKNPYNYPKPLRIKLWMEQVLGEGVLLAEGDAHVQQRKALSPAFSTSSIKDLSSIFWSKGLVLTDLLRRDFDCKNAKQLSFELLEWLNRTTLDVIGEAAFGETIDSLNNLEAPLRHAYKLCFAFDVWSRALHGMQQLVPFTRNFPSRVTRDIAEARQIITSRATEIVQSKQMKTDSGDRDVLSLIIRNNERIKRSLNVDDVEMSFETIRDQIMTFMGAGHDTTATGIAWTLLLLAKNPTMQTRLREEIRAYFPSLFQSSTRRDILDSNDFNTYDVDRLPYLSNVCRESLRYIPPIPLTSRETVAPDTLGGYEIPVSHGISLSPSFVVQSYTTNPALMLTAHQAGTTIYIMANAIHRLPYYWGPTADDFNPDRWDTLPSSYTPNAYMTFLHGPRSCIGRKFAEIEQKVLLCLLLSAFAFERDQSVDDPEEWKMWRLVLRPKDGISLRVSLLEQ